MWNEIKNEYELQQFLVQYGDFHDCCLKELRYVSGAFVDKDKGMHPISNQRKLLIIFQKQCEKNSVIEMEFSKLIKLNLLPNDEMHTSEIIDVSMYFEQEKIYWGDSSLFEEQREKYLGTWLCAERVRWRIVNEWIGNEEIY